MADAEVSEPPLPDALRSRGRRRVDEDRAERIADLVQVTGLAEERAEAALRRYAWNAQVAAQHFFENGLSDVPDSPTDSPMALGASRQPQQEQQQQQLEAVDPARPDPSGEELESQIQQVLAILSHADPAVVRSLLTDSGGDVESTIETILFYEREDALLKDWMKQERSLMSRLQQRSAHEDELSEYLSQKSPAKVTCNVYKLAPENTLEKVALGIYHSGIEVYGREWSFGGNPDPEYKDLSGVFYVPPESAVENFYRKIDLGETELSPQEVLDVLKPLQQEWLIGSYHLLQRNCNHFSSALAPLLGVKKPPGWVNRAARVGNTLVPNRVVNYFLSMASGAPEAAVEDKPKPEPSRREKKGSALTSWFRRKSDKGADYAVDTPAAAAATPDAEFAVGDAVTLRVPITLDSTGGTIEVKTAYGTVTDVGVKGAGRDDLISVRFHPQRLLLTDGDEIDAQQFEIGAVASTLMLWSGGEPPDPPQTQESAGGAEPTADESAHVETLQGMFPDVTPGEMLAALRRHSGNLNGAIDSLLWGASQQSS